jgi:hypothetical protein
VTLTSRLPARRRSRATSGVLFRCAELPDDHVTKAFGTQITTPARTVIDLARTLPFMRSVVMADSALQAGKTTREQLANVCDHCARWPGIGQARRVAAFSNELAESALESCARVTFDAFGLETPEIQVTVRGPGFVFRADFCWERHKTIAEADGLAKYATAEDILGMGRPVHGRDAPAAAVRERGKSSVLGHGRSTTIIGSPPITDSIVVTESEVGIRSGHGGVNGSGAGVRLAAGFVAAARVAGMADLGSTMRGAA